MYPHTKYDKQNGLAYIRFSGKEIERSIESEDELFVLDIDKNGELIGIEIICLYQGYKKTSLSFPLRQKNRFFLK